MAGLVLAGPGRLAWRGSASLIEVTGPKASDDTLVTSPDCSPATFAVAPAP